MCPRCGTATPPTSDPFVQCASCKLSFDPTSEPVGTRTRKRANTATEIEHGPAGISLEREPGEWTIKIPDQRIIGICYVVIGAVLGMVFLEVKSYEGQEQRYLLALVGFALVFAYVGIAKVVSNLTVRIDERQLTATHGPLPLQRRVWIGRNEITKVRGEKSDSTKYPYVVFADTPRGPIAIAGIRDAAERGAEAAAFVGTAVRDGLEATAAKTEAAS
jgi:hypothetical protein